MAADQSFESRARKMINNKGTALNLMEPLDPQPKVSVFDALADRVIIPAHQQAILHETSFDITFTPQNAVSGGFLTSGGVIDFVLPVGSGGGTVNNILLEFDVTNTTGAACTLVPAPLLLADVSIYVGNGNSKIQQIRGDHLFTDLCFLSQENLQAMAPSFNTTATLGAGTPIANNSTVTYYIPLMSCFLTQGHIYVPAINNGLLFRFNFLPSTVTVENGAAPTIVNPKLHLIGDSLPMEHHETIMKEYATNVYDFRYTECLINSIPLTISAGSTYASTLQGLQGMLAGGFVVIRQGTTGAALRTFNSINKGTIDITTANGTTILGIAKRGDYNRIFEWQTHFGNTIASTQPIYLISHAASLASVVNSGVMQGFNYYDGTMRLVLVTDATWNPGAYSIDFICKQYATIRINRGRVEPPLFS